MLEIKDMIGVGITSILGILWWDIRSIRKERQEAEKEIDKKLSKYLHVNTHALLCENATLRQRSELKEYIDDKFNDLKAFIKNNHK